MPQPLEMMQQPRGRGGAATSCPRTGSSPVEGEAQPRCSHLLSSDRGWPATRVPTALPGEDVRSGSQQCQRQAPHWCSMNRENTRAEA